VRVEQVGGADFLDVEKSSFVATSLSGTILMPSGFPCGA
jgi:hypothetical protein